MLTSPARRWALRQPFRFISAAPFHFNSAEFPRPSPALPHTVLHIGLPAAARKDVVGCDAVSTPVGPTIQISRRYDIHLQVTLLTKHVSCQVDQGSDDVPNLCWVDAAVRKVELLDLAAVGVAEGLDVGLAIAHAASRAAVASRIVSVRQCGVEGGGRRAC